MKMIAIHKEKNSFSDRWIEYCINQKVPYKIVNCYDSDIIQQLKDCSALMWHIDHMEFRDYLFAKQLLVSVEKMGKKVFPDTNTSWHFDDKIGQKYLLEAIDAPLVPTYLFYSKKDALSWIETATFPKVFKLRNGSGSANVKLVNNLKEAKKLVEVSFSTGHNSLNYNFIFKERLRKYIKGKVSIYSLGKWFLALFLRTGISGMYRREIGYILFQDFIPNNKFDIRIVIVNDKAFGLKRIVRKNDFRASGSGNIIYGKQQIPISCVKLAFDLNRKINGQSMAFDFVFDQDLKPLIVELSFGYAMKAYDKCDGYWDSDLNFHEGKISPQDWMIESILNS